MKLEESGELSPKIKEALKEKQKKNYKVIMKAFMEFAEEGKEQFVDDVDVTDVYRKDIYPSDLFAVSLDFYYYNLSVQLLDGNLTIMNSQITYIDKLVHQLTSLNNELKIVRETKKATSLSEFLLQNDSAYRSFCDKHGYHEPDIGDEEKNADEEKNTKET